MGKDGGFLTAKAISKRIKAKGLGRLRWYCQMCEKQCRDENGFKCHTQSASHRRQLALFAENSSSFITRFSNDFRKEYLLVLRQRFGTNFVNANTVYQEHIKDKEHVHMNATKWTTLTAFVKDLGKHGYCRVEERPDGFWVAYLDREASERNRKAREMDQLRMEDEEKKDLELRRKIEAAAALSEHFPSERVESDEPSTNAGPVSVEIVKKALDENQKNPPSDNPLAKLGSSSNDKETAGSRKGKRRRSRWQDAPKVSVLQEIIQEEQAKRTETPLQSSTEGKEGRQGSGYNSSDKPVEGSENVGEPWIMEGIIVKVTNKELEGGAFSGRKGKVVKVIDSFGARVSMNDSSAVLEVDQDDLETVIPKPGGKVILLRGKHRGCFAVVKSINIERFSITVSLENSNEVLHDIDYENASRIA